MNWKTCKTHGPEKPAVWGCPECLRELREENKRLRYHLAQLGAFADAAAMVLATLEAEDTTEEEKLQDIIDGISTWAAPAILGEVKGSNVEVTGAARPYRAASVLTAGLCPGDDKGE